MQSMSQIILAVLDVYPEAWGTVDEIHEGEDSRFVLIFEDKPWDLGARWNVAQAVNLFVRKNTLKMICIDGASGYIRTEMLRDYPFEEQRKKVAKSFFEGLKLSPGEYCSVVNPDKPFVLCGVEDKNLYAKAGKIWKELAPEHDPQGGLFISKNRRKMDRFCRLEFDRALAIRKNILQRMEEHHISATGLICCGNLPSIVGDILKAWGISFARITPRMTGDDKTDDYLRTSQGERTVVEHLVSKLDRKVCWPEDGDFEKHYIKDRYDSETRFEKGESLKQLMPDISTLFSTDHFKALSVHEKREVLRQLIPDSSYWILKEIVPKEELEKIFDADERFLDLQALLSEKKFEQFPDFNEKIEDIVSRVPDADLQKILTSSTVRPGIKAALKQHIDKKKTLENELFQQLSNIEFEEGHEFDRKMDEVIRTLPQDKLLQFMASPAAAPRVKQALMKNLLLPSLKSALDSEIVRNVKPGPLGLGALGILMGVGGILFESAFSLWWYQGAIFIFLFFEGLYCFRVQRPRAAVSFLIYCAAFIGGGGFYGRWGALVCIFVAFLLMLLIKPNRDDEEIKHLKSCL